MPPGLTADQAEQFITDLATSINAANPKMKAKSNKNYQPDPQVGDPAPVPGTGAMQPLYFCHNK
ncbi:MAG TPA: hypothetical protein VIR16_08495 [Candidatus Limnocylindrales bacterium]